MILHKHRDATSSTQRLIQAGDLVVVYERHDSMKPIYVTPGQSYGNRYGNFKLKDWVGKPYGSRVQAFGPNATGWVYLLAPTPELWSLVLRHRTQILYIADISLVCTFLELKPGCTVLESGTGSGSLTHSLARAVAPTGHVHTFEFHQLRAEAAEKEFKEHGLGELVTTQQRNIEELGFPDSLHGKADGVFLDLPGPWHAVASAAQCLRPDGVFCSFSPCIEQVQRTCAALEEQGFYGVRTMECLLRHYEVRQEKIATCDDLNALDNQQGSSKRKRQEQHQPRKKQAVAQTAPVAEVTVQLPIQATEGSTASLDVTGVPDETDADMELGMQDKMAAAPAEAQTTAGSQQKSVAILADTQGATASKQVAQPQTDDQPAAMTGQSQNTQGVIPVTHTHQLISADAADGVVQQANQAKAKPSFEQLVLAKPLNDARGHTGYLTFARRSVDD